MVEIKSFLSPSPMRDFEIALCQLRLIVVDMEREEIIQWID
ncbi:hypothetical protein [Iningainema tapete]